MNNNILSQATQAAQRGERLSREKDAFRYTCAWDRGDLETVCKLRERALDDKELEQILDELDLEFAEEMEKEMEKEAKPVSEEEARKMHAKVKHLMKQYNEER